MTDRSVVDERDDECVTDPAMQGRARARTTERPAGLPDIRGDLSEYLGDDETDMVHGLVTDRLQSRITQPESRSGLGHEIDVGRDE